MEGEEGIVEGNWNQYNGCCNGAYGFLFPGYFDIKRNQFLHCLVISICQCFLAAPVNECLKSTLNLSPFLRRTVSQKCGKPGITNLMDIVQIDVHCLLRTFQNTLELLRNSLNKLFVLLLFICHLDLLSILAIRIRRSIYDQLISKVLWNCSGLTLKLDKKVCEITISLARKPQISGCSRLPWLQPGQAEEEG